MQSNVLRLSCTPMHLNLGTAFLFNLIQGVDNAILCNKNPQKKTASKLYIYQTILLCMTVDT